jgi:hypothetical protein
MKTQLRLNSVVPHGVGSGSESLAIDLIYEFLLHEFKQDIYSYISINQVGSDLNEFVMKEAGNKVHVNIRYPVDENFETRNSDEKNKIRLDIIHTSLLRIAEADKKLDVVKLEAIRRKILENNFDFYFACKSHLNKKNPTLVGKVIVKPDELIIWGKNKEMEIHVLVDECKADLVNLTKYANPPYFTLMRADISEEERAKAYQDWHHSLPPAVASVIRQANN